MRFTLVLSLLVLLCTFGKANADWDSKGWVKLGEREVNGRVDRDTIAVGKYEGRFSKLTMVVEKSELELLDFEVTFGNGEHWRPEGLHHFFRKNQSTRVIDLPGDERVIKEINVKYKNVADGKGNARVEIWGLKDERVVQAKPVWNNSGWTKLGEREVNGRVDRDTISVGRYEGRFSKLTLVVEKSEMELLDFEVTFANGEHWRPDGLHHYFREGTRTRVIDLPGDERVIKEINLKYKNVADGKGNARVEVWGLKGEPVKAYHFERKGWTDLGERLVNGRGREDDDRIEIGRKEGKFRRLAIVVEDGEIELIDMKVKFGNGDDWHPDMKHYFREGQRSREIDLPGDLRTIKYVEFRYRNVASGQHAKVLLLGR